MPSADLLYSNPYDAFMTKETTGGWVDMQKIGDRSCDHVAYRQPAVDWELWVNEGTRLPCQVKIVYKNAPLQPSTTIVYSAFDPKPQVSDETFAAKVPDGFQRIKIMRHATVNDPNEKRCRPRRPAGQHRRSSVTVKEAAMLCQTVRSGCRLRRTPAFRLIVDRRRRGVPALDDRAFGRSALGRLGQAVAEHQRGC